MPKQTKTEEPAAEGKGGKKKLIVIVLVLALLGGGAYWMFLRPAPAEEPAPEPGEVVALDPIQINLAAEHYLRVGIALQMTADAHGADGSKALDATISTFSGKSIDEVNNPEKRTELKKELEKEVAHLYHDEVMELYFTEFVTQ